MRHSGGGLVRGAVNTVGMVRKSPVWLVGRLEGQNAIRGPTRPAVTLSDTANSRTRDPARLYGTRPDEHWVSRQMPMEMEIMLFSMPQIMPPFFGEIMPNYALSVELCWSYCV